MHEIAKTERLAVFDVCDTLYYSNTTHDFIRYYVGHRGTAGKKALFAFTNHRFSPLRYMLIAVGVFTGWDVLKKLNVAMLSGASEREVDETAAAFVAEFLQGRKIKQTHDLIRACRETGQTVVLCSSSIEPVVAAVARELGVDAFVSTTLKRSGARHTGRIKEETSGKKVAAIASLLGGGAVELAVSDNVSDLDLLLSAQRAIAVSHNARKRTFWKDRNMELIDLDV